MPGQRLSERPTWLCQVAPLRPAAYRCDTTAPDAPIRDRRLCSLPERPRQTRRDHPEQPTSGGATSRRHAGRLIAEWGGAGRPSRPRPLSAIPHDNTGQIRGAAIPHDVRSHGRPRPAARTSQAPAAPCPCFPSRIDDVTGSPSGRAVATARHMALPSGATSHAYACPLAAGRPDRPAHSQTPPVKSRRRCRPPPEHCPPMRLRPTRTRLRSPCQRQRRSTPQSSRTRSQPGPRDVTAQDSAWIAPGSTAATTCFWPRHVLALPRGHYSERLLRRDSPGYPTILADRSKATAGQVSPWRRHRPPHVPHPSEPAGTGRQSVLRPPAPCLL